jgi:excisionase family DNA binding protein
VKPTDQQPTAAEPLWTVADVLAFTRMRRTWLYERIARNELPHYRLGGAVRFNPQEIRAWLERTRVEGAVRGVRRSSPRS